MKNDFIVEQLTRSAPHPTPPPELKERLLEIARTQENRATTRGSWSLAVVSLGTAGGLVVTACLLVWASLGSPAGLHAAVSLYTTAVRSFFAVDRILAGISPLAMAVLWAALGLLVAALCLRWHRLYWR
ncbi:hypothetical protein [Alicyclobacillus sp. ALC3]|uniref:hypothetical protein n=1 Tax=Alicyclobacillus sp. ALC3 TaxID=2796143 RepID=UPI00237970FD|nr:hypothetical protein [Alicyclobacillus sp. ALC3]WDL98767.1 hypothetical protein JC200_08985 [Alicyclobacillus sp. ALC3]